MDAQTLFIIIVLIVVFQFLLERWLDYLNESMRTPELPAELQGIYDRERYRKSQEYQHAKTRLGMLAPGVNIVLILLMLFLDGFAWLNTLVERFTTHSIFAGLLFFGAIGIAGFLAGLPFTVYATFVIEEKFGFNRTTVRTFIFDRFKGLLLGVFFGGALYAILVWFKETAGALFWIYAWIAFSVISLFMTAFYTSLILPLFNKLTPLKEGELREAIEKYCRSVGFKLDNLFVMDGSRRSVKANAFFSGLGPKKKIVLYDTLIERHTTGELVAVLAHETGHYKKKHTLIGSVVSIAEIGLMLYLLSLCIDNQALSGALGVPEVRLHTGLFAFGLLYSPLSMLLGLFGNIVSRKNEYAADDYAKKTWSGKDLGDALKKLSVDNLSNLRPHPAYVFFHYSHPPLLKRLMALEIRMNFGE